MDPNAALEELRRLLAQKYLDDLDDAERIQLLFKSLDEWLSNKGFLPKDWERKEVHFDSCGHIHGRAGYEIVKKDPFAWQAQGNPSGFWTHYVIWGEWVRQDASAVDRMSFRRDTTAKPITHEELNG